MKYVFDNIKFDTLIDAKEYILNHVRVKDVPFLFAPKIYKEDDKGEVCGTCSFRVLDGKVKFGRMRLFC